MTETMTEHDAATEAARQQGQIGYYNHNGYPVSIATTRYGRLEVAPQEAFTRRGVLIVHDPVLESWADDRLIRRINPKDPNYKKFAGHDARKAQQSRTPTQKAATAPIPAAPGAPSQELPPDAAVDGDGKIHYQGHVFNSVAALHTYLDRQKPLGTSGSAQH